MLGLWSVVYMSKQFQNPIESRNIDTPNAQIHEHLKEQRLIGSESG